MRGWKNAEQLRGHHVDAFVGALRAQDGRDEQLKRRLEVELAMRVGVLALQPCENLERVCGELGAFLTFRGRCFLGAALRGAIFQERFSSARPLVFRERDNFVRRTRIENITCGEPRLASHPDSMSTLSRLFRVRIRPDLDWNA